MASWSLDAQFVKVVHTALKQLRHERELGNHPLCALTAVEEQRCQHGEPDTPLGRANALHHVFRTALRSLSAQDATAAELLERRFWQGESVVQMAYQQGTVESTFYARQGEAIQALAHHLWAIEQAAQRQRAERAQRLQRNLPPPTYTRLFGVDDILARLQAMLTAPEGPWLISIEGLGGLGKTALAHRLACWAASTDLWTDIVWVTAQRQALGAGAGIVGRADEPPVLTLEGLSETVAIQLGCPELLSKPLSERQAALHALLKACPYLIVVDNMEMATDHQALVPQLWKLACPTRFLLTSRHCLGQHPLVFCCTLGELGQADSLALMRFECAARGVTALAQADDAALRHVYAVAGGNPLAIRLVVGQTRDLPLKRVLAHLQEAADQPYEELYQFIYRRAWELLSEDARLVLLAMPAMAASSAYWEDLLATTHLSATRLDATIEELVGMSLLNTGGENHKRYTIYRLTYSFLMSGLLKGWYTDL